MTDFLGCGWGESKFLIFSPNVYDPLVYYSHLLPLAISLFLGFFIFLKSRKELISKVFITLNLLFSLYIFFDLILWASEKPDQIMFFWSLLGTIEFFIFFTSFYLLYVFIINKRSNFYSKLFIFILYMPIFVLTSTSKNLIAFDYSNCDRGAFEGPMLNYVFVIEGFVIVCSLIYSILIFIKEQNYKEKKNEIALFSTGVIIFMSLFFAGNMTVFSDMSWSYEQYKYFGMALFLAIIVFMVVRFKTFNIRLVGAQALVVTLIAFLGSRLFINETGVSRLITFVNLAIVSFVGYFLIKSVKKEISTREKIETLADQLEHTNEKLRVLDQQKTQFVSLASHQLRAPLTAIKGYLSMILEGDYGEITTEQKEMVERVEKSADNLVTIVGDFLDVSRIEQGKMRYDWTDFDLKPLIEIVDQELSPIAEKKGIVLNTHLESGIEYMIHGDMNKLKQVLVNLVDNSIKYTIKGEVKLTLSRPMPSVIRLEIKDTGIGISAETLPKLFDKFVRAEGANDVNVIGTGLGLFVAKEMIKAHAGGKIWAESEGLGKGSRFVVELKGI